MKYIMGIDPGLLGAVCVLNSRGHIVHIEDLKPTMEIPLLDIYPYKNNDEVLVVMEDALTVKFQGLKSTATTLYNYGRLSMYAEERARVKRVHPKTWQTFFNIASRKGKPRKKEDGLIIAGLLLPENDLQYFHTENGKLLDGRLEAYLIAEYGRMVTAVELRTNKA